MKHTIRQAKQILGVLDAVVTHVVEKTEATINWTGPKIGWDQWQEMLAFFKWTYDLNRSESQVRLFVNKDRWAIWAFPQKANTGMTAIELDTEEASKQRDLFSEKDGWHYFGTVHSHCDMQAFASGTDEHNEEKIDGLHMTVGKLASDKYDLHARFLIGGQSYGVNLTWFWDVGEIGKQLPEEMHHQVAKFQMTKPIDKDQKFPEQWKENYIEVKPEIKVYDHRGTGRGWPDEKDPEYAACKVPEWKRKKIEKAMDEFETDLFQRNVDIEALHWFDVVIDFQDYDHAIMDFIKAIGKADVVWEDVLTLAEFLQDREREKEEKEIEAEEKEAEELEAKELTESGIEALHREMEAEGGNGGPNEEDANRFLELERIKKEREARELEKEIEREAMMRQIHGDTHGY